jgi:hypothetical protein
VKGVVSVLPSVKREVGPVVIDVRVHGQLHKDFSVSARKAN